MELFLDRAQAVDANAGPSAEVEEICRRLDGLPLALELAAARAEAARPRDAARAARLPALVADTRAERHAGAPADARGDDRVELRPAPPRRTGGLSPALHLRRHFDVEAAEAVVEADLEELATLVDASLLKSRGDSRFLMLETIREFARRACRQSSDEAARPPRAAYLALAEAAAPHLTGHEAGSWLARLDADAANLGPPSTGSHWTSRSSASLRPFALALLARSGALRRGPDRDRARAAPRPGAGRARGARLPARRDRDLTRRHARASTLFQNRSTASVSSACSAARPVA